MDEITIEGGFYLISVFVFFMWGIATYLFGRISVKHIEREMAKEGLEPAVWDKGIGGRIIMYSMVIVANKAAKHSPIADEEILRYTRKKDKQLAWFYFLTMVSFFIILIVFYFFFAPDDILS
ncbi:hypothetical protein NBRC116592_09850 [Colwellia sp. KU-HH00111]|uniref:hypothetical protein n=1 Tax=Colwellia sp. KU-HH00111 TaxID=3127652 RepID=UPI00310A11B0